MDYRMFSEKIVELAEVLNDLRLNKKVLNYYKDIQQYFNEVMDAFLQKDDKLAFLVWVKKDMLFNKAHILIKNLDSDDKEKVKDIMRIAHKIKSMSALI
jgi:hypothetical protein